MVKILMFGHALREAVEDPEVEIALEEPMSLRQLLNAYPEQFEGLAPFLSAHQLMLTINQKISTLEAEVKDGDIVKITHQVTEQHDGAMWHNP